MTVSKEEMLDGLIKADRINAIKELVKILNYWTKCYDEGHPKVSDKEWDDYYFKLVELEKESGIVYPDSPTQKINYEVVSQLSKIEHNHNMLSLDKTKSIDEVESFIGNKDFIAMAKMDGLTCSLRYINGELVSAETRGNGLIGEDITHNAKVIPSIPKHIAYNEELVVDGEVVCLWNDFLNFESSYKNPRNFAAGSIRLLDAKECANRKLTFIAWDMVKGYLEENSFSNRLDILSTLGFNVVPWVKENPAYVVNDIRDYCEQHGYPIDGVVFKFDDVAYGKTLGETAHHARNAIAYKFYDELYDTILKDIEWSMGRLGTLTPIAIFEPTELDGAIIERASLHNLDIMENLLAKPFVGQEIQIYKANAIIPQVAPWKGGAITGDYITPPDVCPICGKPTKIITSDTGVHELYCSNPECAGKLINQLDHFLGKKGLDIKGISAATLEKLIDWGWVTSKLDIFNLSSYADDWKKKPGFGEKSVSNILNSIEKGKNTTLEKFISSLGIPFIGPNVSKELVKYFPTWTDFKNSVDTKFNYNELPDFGDSKTQALLNFDYAEADKIAELLTFSITSVESNDNQSLANKKIVITGNLHYFKNRSELQAKIEAAGGKVVSSISKNVDMLINNDITSNSAKNKAAKANNIPIISEEDFCKEFFDL